MIMLNDGAYPRYYDEGTNFQKAPVLQSVLMMRPESLCRYRCMEESPFIQRANARTDIYILKHKTESAHGWVYISLF